MRNLRIAVGVTLALVVCLFTIALTSSNWITPALARGGNAAPSASEPWKTNGSRIEAGDYLGTKNNEPLVFKVKKAERMRIDTSGRVGIGTASPQAALDLASGRFRLSSAFGDIEFTEVADLLANIAQTTPSPVGPALRVFTGGGASRVFTVLNNGNVGIGTVSPQAPLEVATGRIRLSSGMGDIEFTEVADLIAHTTEANPTATDPAFRVDTGTGLARAFTVLNNGNVGIGIPNPDARLLVRGDGQTFLMRVQDNTGKDVLKVVNNGVVSFGALYSLSSTNHLCYHAPANLALTTCSSAAEYVPTIDGGSGFPQTADLVSIAPTVTNPYGDTHGPFTVQKSTTPCDSNLFGYIVKPESGADGIKLNDHYLPLAIFGYFPAKVTLENGTIRRGDPLTSSSKPGYAMKATSACKIIGYALEDAPIERQIQVFANLGDNSATEVASLRGKVETLTQENLTLKQELSTLEARLAALEQKMQDQSPLAAVRANGD